MSPVTQSTSEALRAAVSAEGFAFVDGPSMRQMLRPFGALADWEAFAESWGRLELDTYMADGGRYRRRRHATYTAPSSGPR